MIKALKKYTVFHFSTEERYMKQHIKIVNDI
jgi:hemerythrin